MTPLLCEPTILSENIAVALSTSQRYISVRKRVSTSEQEVTPTKNKPVDEA
ncbi:hypothetical protein LguiA_036744 [Lonicera macranthoides]